MPVGRGIWSVLLVVLLFCSMAVAAYGADEAPPMCLGHIPAVEVHGDSLFVGTSAGLFYYVGPTKTKDSGELIRVEGLRRGPAKSLKSSNDNGRLTLRLVFGDLKGVELSTVGDDDFEGAFTELSPFEGKKEAALRTFLNGYLITGTVEIEGVTYTATLGGGLYSEPYDGASGAVEGSPAHITAIVPWSGGAAVASGDAGGALYSFDGTQWKTLYRSPAADCAITSFVEWKGQVYAGTLSGGVLRLPNYESIGGLKGLSARINDFATSKDKLYIATEAGLYSWDGEVAEQVTGAGKDAIKSVLAVGGEVFYITKSRFMRYLPKKDEATALAPNGGMFLALHDGDFYIGGMYGVWRVKLLESASAQRLLHEFTTGFAKANDRLYVATYYSGLWKMGNTENEKDDKASKVVEGEFNTIAADGETIVMGTGSDGVVFPDVDSGEIIRPAVKAWQTETITALYLSGGRVYIGTPAGYSVVPLKELLR